MDTQKWMVYMIFGALLVFEFILVVDGTHFLGGTQTWRLLNASATGTPVAVVITQTYIWSYSLIQCTNAMIAGNQLVPSYLALASDTLNCIANCGSGSVGYVSLNVIPYCVDFSAPLGISVGKRSDIVYLTAGDDFSVAYQSTAWRTLATGASAGWSVSSRINVKLRTDNGLYNNAPVATVVSPTFILANQITAIHVPIADADGDILRCRWATKSNGTDECAGVCPPSSLPPGTVIYPNCTILITGQTVGDWFAVALMVEDFSNSTSTIPLSSVPVQFLLSVVASPSCLLPPEIIGEPVEDSCTLIQVGQTYSSQLIAVNNCGSGVTINDIATLSFSGMIKSNLTKLNSSIYSKSLTWTPTMAQIGYQVMCAMAFNSQSSQSAQYCFKFYVSTNNLCSCPGEACITSSTTTTTTTTTTSTTFTTTTSTESTTSTLNSSANSTTGLISSTILTSSESTTSSSKLEDNFIQWIVIGALVGIPLLATLIGGGCLCWYYCSPCGIGRIQLSDCQGSFQFYHIESIDQGKFRSSKAMTKSTTSRSTAQKKYRVYKISPQSSSSSFDTRRMTIFTPLPSN